MNVYQTILEANKRYHLYEVRHLEYCKDIDEVPFRVSPSPLCITHDQYDELIKIGNVICNYVKLVIKLYQSNKELQRILNKGKPDIFLKFQNPQYLFLRPDLILTENGFKICEFETSIFGLALSDILNKAYIENDFQTVVEKSLLQEYISSQIAEVGNIAYSKRVKAFQGQLEYLANEIFTNKSQKWNAQMIDGSNNFFSSDIYRAFYSSDCFSDNNMEEFLKNNVNCIPTLTPQFEEKALLALIWDVRFCHFFKNELGNDDYDFLRTIIPPTCIVGEEEYFEKYLPALDTISNLPKSQRKFVLKKSGDSSWGEGITFLHKISHEKVQKAIDNARVSNELYILQYFSEGKKTEMKYFSSDSIQTMTAKIRITPYYAFSGEATGKLISVKATGCENTDYIHGATNSINTSISI